MNVMLGKENEKELSVQEQKSRKYIIYFFCDLFARHFSFGRRYLNLYKMGE